VGLTVAGDGTWASSAGAAARRLVENHKRARRNVMQIWERR